MLLPFGHTHQTTPPSLLSLNRSEIDVIMRTNYYRAVNMSLFFSSAKLVVFLALLTYVLTGNVLTAEKVFVTSALINNVRLVMTLFFPFGIAMGAETLISCKRLQVRIVAGGCRYG